MNGYSVTEAASILGVSTERIWELLARGVLAGEPDGEGMRVILKATSPSVRADPVPGPQAGDGPEPQRESSPFRELLTEFRNLTERYGQALLALGESRGEVASLRSRVDLLEARMDLRLPFAGAADDWPTPSARGVEAGLRPPSRAPEPATPPVVDQGEEEDEERRSRRRRHRRATESFAEAMGRAEDPTAPELPDATEAAAALAALRDVEGTVDAGPHRSGGSADSATAASPTAASPPPATAPSTGAVATPAGPSLDSGPPVVSDSERAVTMDAPPVAPVELPPLPVVSDLALPRELPAAEAMPTMDASPTAIEDVAPPESPAAHPAEGPDAAGGGMVSDEGADASEAARDDEGLEELQPVIVSEPEPVAVDEPVAEAAVEPVEADPEVLVEEAEAPKTAGTMAPPAPEAIIAPSREPEVAEPEPPVTASPTDPVAPGSGPASAGAAIARPPIDWDPERYTVEISQPDWFAGEEPVVAEPPLAPSEVEAGPADVPALAPDSAALGATVEPVSDPIVSDEAEVDAAVDAAVEAAAAPDAEEVAARSDPRPTAGQLAAPEAVPPAPSAAEAVQPDPAPALGSMEPPTGDADEEEVLWFGRRPGIEGSEEREPAGSGGRIEGLPGGTDLEDALAALRARARAPREPEGFLGRSSTGPPATPARGPASSTETPATPVSPTPASRAYRRLRRIFPG